MAIEDLSIDVGVDVDDTSLDALITKLESLEGIEEQVSPVEIDVEVNDDALDSIGESSIDEQHISVDANVDVSDLDLDIPELEDQTLTIDSETDLSELDVEIPDEGIEIPVSGTDETFTLTPDVDLSALGDETIELTISEEATPTFNLDVPDDFDGFNIEMPETDGGITDGGVTDGDGRSPLESLDVESVREVELLAGDQFDPRGLLNKELTMHDVIFNEDAELFDVRQTDVDDLFFRERQSTPVEEAFIQSLRENPDRFAMFSDILTLNDDIEARVDNIGAVEGVDIPDSAMPDLERDIIREDMFKFPGNKSPFERGKEKLFGIVDSLSLERFYRIIARLVPLLVTFVMALPAAIVAIGTLAVGALAAASALMAVGGLALIGGAFMLGGGDLQAGFKELTKILREDIMPVLRTLGGMFDDLFIDMLNGFESFMQAMASNAQVLTRLKDEARAVGQFIIAFVPPALAMLAKLGEAFAPLFGLFGEWLKMNFDNLLVGFVRATAKALPLVLGIVDAVIQFLPLLFDLSLGFLYVTSILFRFIGLIGNVLNALGPFGTMIGIIIGAALTLFSLIAVGASLFQFFGSVIYYTIPAMWTYISSLYTAALAEGVLSLATLQLTVIVGVLLGMLTLGLVPILGLLSGGFLGLSSDIGQATKALDKFANAQSGVGSMGGMGFGGPTSGLTPESLNPYSVSNTTNITVEGDADKDDMNVTGKRANYYHSQFKPY